MKEPQINVALDELVELVGAGKWEIAFEKYYHDNLEKTDLDGVVMKGKAESYRVGKEFASKITAVRDFSGVGKVVKGNRSFLVWSLDFDHADNGQVKVVQVAIQDWKDGKIIRERFFA